MADQGWYRDERPWLERMDDRFSTWWEVSDVPSYVGAALVVAVFAAMWMLFLP